MRTALLTLAVGGLLAAGLAVPANAAHEELVVTGLGQNGKLVTFLAGTGERLSQSGKVSGLLPGEDLVAIDFRPANGVLYGVATDGSQGRVYTIDPRTAVATPLALVFAITGDVSVDFNPAADRLRVVSTDGDNYRLNVNPGALAVITDGDLTTADGSPFAVTGVAYTNNDNDPATPTTLFDVDAVGDRLLKQDPPNAGVLTTVGSLTTDVGTATGFDVYTEGATNIALLSDRDADGTRVYTLNLTTGSVNRTPTSPVLVQGTPVLDIAVDPRQ